MTDNNEPENVPGIRDTHDHRYAHPLPIRPHDVFPEDRDPDPVVEPAPVEAQHEDPPGGSRDVEHPEQVEGNFHLPHEQVEHVEGDVHVSHVEGGEHHD